VLGLLSDAGPHGVLAAARRLGAVLEARLAGLVGRGVVAVRCTGLWAGVDVDPRLGSGRAVSEALARRGVLVKDTHGSTVRLSPPLVVTEEEIAFAVGALAESLDELG
jgi:ornithine--oxo-acid transaminase